MANELSRTLTIPSDSALNQEQYEMFLTEAYRLMAGIPLYLAPNESIDAIELAHMIPSIPETVIALYVGINDAVCNKGLVTPFLLRHGHSNVYAFDPESWGGGDDVPDGTVDMRVLLREFEPPNATWRNEWTYVAIQDPSRTYDSLWHERGYIDMIAAKFEDFTMLSDPDRSSVCVFIDEKAFAHPVNAARDYLKEARKRGEARAHEYVVPTGMTGETNGLVPVILNKGEKLFVATPDFGPCEHAWSNIHPHNAGLAVINENSAVPLDLIVSKPPVVERYSTGLVPAKGSADMTTDIFFRGTQVYRRPLLEGAVKG